MQASTISIKKAEYSDFRVQKYVRHLSHPSRGYDTQIKNNTTKYSTNNILEC